MAIKKADINDWARGTTLPIRFNAKNQEGEPISLVNHTIYMVIRDEQWEDSLSDNTARVKHRCRFWESQNADGLILITEANIGDICWLVEEGLPMQFDGQNWLEVNAGEYDVINGRHTIRFTREEAMLPVGSYYYSIDIKFPNGDIGKAVRGKFKVTYNTVNEVL
jgi:hypothetical protein